MTSNPDIISKTVLSLKLRKVWMTQKRLIVKFGLVESQDIGSHLGDHREAESSRSGSRV